MHRFILRRFMSALITLFLVSILIFIIARLQGDPRYLYLSDAARMDKETWDEMGRQMGLDKPVIAQYIVFLGQAFQGDLGLSIHQQRPVMSIVWGRAPATGQLALAAFVFMVVIGVPLGVLSAVKRGTIWDYLGRTFAILGQSMPAFLIAISLVLIFAVWLGWLPTSRRGGLSHYILPSITMGWLSAAGMLRLIRSSMLAVLDSEFVKFARSKGVSGFRVIWKHALRNALLAPLTYAGLTLAWMMTGSIILESVFAWPGVGLLAIQATRSADYPLLQATVLFVAVGYVAISFLVDVLYAYVDPRIRYA
ncbi:MAG: ABC transporter permease [Chloroflexota bacterium]|nr:ABC transporter permease [Chloroflexota bacterium]